MKRAIVVGSGAGGATIARALQGPFDVTVLEAGPSFQPFTRTLDGLEKWRTLGLLFDAREIGWVFPSMQIRKTGDDMILVNGLGSGGTTTICTGNGIRMDGDLQALGIDLDAEFAEIATEIPVTTAHQQGWRETTNRLFDICREMALDPRPTPKMGHHERCLHCGRCVFGCQFGVKWDSRAFLQDALDRGARLVTDCKVERVAIEHGRATGVLARQGWRHAFYPADLVVLAAGGFATPVILDASGIACDPTLFVDPVLCMAGLAEDCRQCYELEMPFVIQREGYIVSPYFDYLSFFFNRDWRHPAKDILSIMVKIADSGQGTADRHGIRKRLTAEDRRRLDEGIALGTEILARYGIEPLSVFLGTLNAGHPGGTLPLAADLAQTLHDNRLPPNLYVADASVLPSALGNPPILTIVALAKRIGRICVETFAA